MLLIGVDYHPSFQTIAFFVEETGEYGEQELNHSDGQAEKFYRDLKQRGISVRVGMEATGYSRWFERLLAELGFELWIGDPAEIKAKRVKKQKFDREDARLLLRLLRENNFPQIWVPSPENRDLYPTNLVTSFATKPTNYEPPRMARTCSPAEPRSVKTVNSTSMRTQNLISCGCVCNRLTLRVKSAFAS